MTTLNQPQVYHEQAKQFFEKTANQIAREKKFVQRQSPLDGSIFLLSLVLTVFEYGTMVLDQLAVMAHQIDPTVAVTGQAFKERFTPVAVAWLQALLAEALKLTAPACGTEVVPLLAVFRAVYLLDSSTITLPDTLQTAWRGGGGAGAKAALKLYLLLDWLTGQYTTLHLEAGRKADQNMGARFPDSRRDMAEIETVQENVYQGSLFDVESQPKKPFLKEERAEYRDILLLCYLDAMGYAARRKNKTGQQLFPIIAERYLAAIEQFQIVREELKLELGRVDVQTGDGRKLDILDNSVDGIITSPPYSFAIDYAENDRPQLEYLGRNTDELKTRMIGLVGGQSVPSRVREYFNPLSAVS